MPLLGRLPHKKGLKPEQVEESMDDIEKILTEISWKRFSHGLPVLILLPVRMLNRAKMLRHLPPKRTVIAVDWRLYRHRYWVDIYKRIRLFYFRIALMGYDFSEPLPFSDFQVDYVEVDLRRVQPERIIEYLPAVHDQTRWVAMHAQDYKQFGFCRQYGFSYFQGPFNLIPKFDAKAFKPAQMRVLQLLQLLENEDTHFEQIEALVEQDPALSAQVVRMANALLREENDPIHSIMDALQRVGTGRFKSWLETLFVADLGNEMPKVVRLALTRAEFIRCIGRMDRTMTPDMYYTVGLFSLMDVLMKHPLDQILRGLKLSRKILEAILEREGTAGRALALIEQLERGDSEQLTLPRGVVPAQVHKCYLEALNYADSVMLAFTEYETLD